MTRIAELVVQLYRGQVEIWESGLSAGLKEAGLIAARDALNVRRNAKLSTKDKMKALGLGVRAQEAALRNDLKAVRRLHAEIKEFDV